MRVDITHDGRTKIVEVEEAVAVTLQKDDILNFDHSSYKVLSRSFEFENVSGDPNYDVTDNVTRLVLNCARL